MQHLVVDDFGFSVFIGATIVTNAKVDNHNAVTEDL